MKKYKKKKRGDAAASRRDKRKKGEGKYGKGRSNTKRE